VIRPGLIIVALAALAAPAAADDPARTTAFCELTPCLQGPFKRRTLTKHERHAGVTCKKGQDLGVDRKQRIAFCTTAHKVKVGGLPVAAGAYTLFHPGGTIYQTHLSGRHVATLADGTTVTCGKGLIALTDTGALRYCTLAGARSDVPAPRIGEGIAFHPDGKRASYTIDKAATIAGLALPAGTHVGWSAKGALVGGTLSGPITVGALTINYAFSLHANGALEAVTLVAAATIQGHEFPAFAKLELRADGTLVRAEYVEDSGFMVHGEPWTDTRRSSYDKDGKITSTSLEHYQAMDSPSSFRERGKR
jgi:hypothetical protein